MTDIETVKAAIEKAIKGGWLNSPSDIFRDTITGLVNERIELECYYGTIFSHSFAKAFWGDEVLVINSTVGVNPKIDAGRLAINSLPASKLVATWEYHLQKMVLVEEPLQYLAKFL